MQVLLAVVNRTLPHSRRRLPCVHLYYWCTFMLGSLVEQLAILAGCACKDRHLDTVCSGLLEVQRVAVGLTFGFWRHPERRARWAQGPLCVGALDRADKDLFSVDTGR